MLPFSVLELCLIEAGKSAADAVLNSVQVPRRAEELGFHRIWYAEQHSSPVVSDFPPAVVMAHVAAVTSSIRVGSGAVLPPNHAPPSLAEQFGALAALYQGESISGLAVARGPWTRRHSEPCAGSRLWRPMRSTAQVSPAMKTAIDEAIASFGTDPRYGSHTPRGLGAM